MIVPLVANGPPRDAELHSRWQEIHEIEAAVEEILAVLTDEALNWRPSPESWSIAQHIDHLSVTWQQYEPAVAAAVEDGCARGVTGRAPYGRSPFVRMFLRFLEPPPTRRAKSPAKFVAPPTFRSVEEVRREFANGQVELARLLLRADGLGLGKLRFSSPVARWMRLSLAECLDVLNTHARRHVWHCQRLLELLAPTRP